MIPEGGREPCGGRSEAPDSRTPDLERMQKGPIGPCHSGRLIVVIDQGVVRKRVKKPSNGAGLDMATLRCRPTRRFPGRQPVDRRYLGLRLASNHAGRSTRRLSVAAWSSSPDHRRPRPCRGPRLARRQRHPACHLLTAGGQTSATASSVDRSGRRPASGRARSQAVSGGSVWWWSIDFGTLVR
jgi:hypothetical protein